MNILHFSYAELSEATGCFTEGMVGIGAFGTVFRASVRGNGPYAIKKLHTVSVSGLVWCGGEYLVTCCGDMAAILGSTMASPITSVGKNACFQFQTMACVCTCMCVCVL